MSDDVVEFGEFTAESAPVSAEIAAVFPDPVPATEQQDFFAANQPTPPNPPAPPTTTQSSPPANPPPPNASSNPNSSGDDRRKQDLGGAKKKKKKKGAKRNDAAEEENGAEKRSELRERLRSRVAMQKELGGKAKLLNQMGVTLDDIGQAAKDEADGKRVSSSKQEQVMNRAKGMFGSVLKGMDSKQKSYLARKTDEVSGMATDLMKKMLSGPGQKSKKKGEDENEAPDLDATLDPHMDDLVRSVHEKAPKPTKASKRTVQSDQLPIRPRASTANRAEKDAANQEQLTKAQTKNKKKRQKTKAKLQLLKQTLNPNTEHAKPEPSKFEPPKPEPSKPEPSKPEPPKPEPSKPEPHKPEPPQPDPPKTAPDSKGSADPATAQPLPSHSIPTSATSTTSK
jgi:hypothetical protein